jgi:peptidoglycan/xylan/chitin deacetylase (PgdA/CDA1 family)
MIRHLSRAALGVALLVLPLSHVEAADCAGNPAALGTARVLAIDPATTPPVGRKQFPVTLPLQPKEIVLTFDDGPWPGTTDRVLAALRAECVHANFFMLGRNAAAPGAGPEGSGRRARRRPS